MEWKNKLKNRVSRRFTESKKENEKEIKKNKRKSTIVNSSSYNSLSLENDLEINIDKKKKHKSICPHIVDPVSWREQSQSIPHLSRKKSRTFSVVLRSSHETPAFIPFVNHSPTDSSLQDKTSEYIEFPSIQEILEDSPADREKLQRIEQQMEQMTSSVRKIVKLSKQVHQAGSHFNQVSAQFAEALSAFRFYDVDDPRSFPLYSTHSPRNHTNNVNDINNDNSFGNVRGSQSNATQNDSIINSARLTHSSQIEIGDKESKKNQLKKRLSFNAKSDTHFGTFQNGSRRSSFNNDNNIKDTIEASDRDCKDNNKNNNDDDNNNERFNNVFTSPEELNEKHAQFISTIKSISESFVQINEYHSTLLKQLSSIFTTPMEEFLRKDFLELKEISKNHKVVKLKYDNAISKYSHIKKNEIDKIAEAEAELHSCRRDFQQSSLFYLSKMKELKSTTPMEFLERSTAFLCAEKAFFQNGYNHHTVLEPKLNQFFSLMATSREVIRNEIDEFAAKISEISAGTENSIGKDTTKGVTTCETKGYLFTKKNNKWSRKYFELKEGQLFCLAKNRETKRISERNLANLLLCTVRPARDVERRFCFEIVSPFNTLIFQAESEELLQYWMLVIQNAIANQLNNQTCAKGSQFKAKKEDSEFNLLQQLHQMNNENLTCCDCGSPLPEWVSINLGVVVCIECSGIHRQLGTHISKVRSLTLDSLEKETQLLLLSLGNKIAKIIFEFDLPPHAVRPNPDSDRATRENWIREKYEARSYVKPPSSSAPDYREIALHKAIRENLLYKVYEKINQGANINWKDPHNNLYSALHVAVISNQFVTCEYLIQNGADCNSRDINGWTPLHHAAFHSRVACSILLIKRSASLDLLDLLDRTPLMIAIENQRAHEVTLLRLAMYAEDEHAENAAFDSESFAAALKSFSEDISDSPFLPLLDYSPLSDDEEKFSLSFSPRSTRRQKKEIIGEENLTIVDRKSGGEKLSSSTSLKTNRRKIRERSNRQSKKVDPDFDNCDNSIVYTNNGGDKEDDNNNNNNKEDGGNNDVKLKESGNGLSARNTSNALRQSNGIDQSDLKKTLSGSKLGETLDFIDRVTFVQLLHRSNSNLSSDNLLHLKADLHNNNNINKIESDGDTTVQLRENILKNSRKKNLERDDGDGDGDRYAKRVHSCCHLENMDDN